MADPSDRDTADILQLRIKESVYGQLKMTDETEEGAKQTTTRRILSTLKKLTQLGLHHKEFLDSLKDDEGFEFSDDLYAELFELV